MASMESWDDNSWPDMKNKRHLAAVGGRALGWSVCYLEEAVSVREVTVEVAALVQLLEQGGDAIPLSPFVPLQQQT